MIQNATMNYYRKYPGDYAGDTSHLSLTEHGAYNKLMDYCYGKDTIEIPSSDAILLRVCGAVTRLEKQAVRSVVKEFFPNGINPRVQRQLPEELKRVEASRANGASGGRPAKKPGRLPSGFLHEETQPDTQRGTQVESSPTPTPTPTPPPTPAPSRESSPLSRDPYLQKAEVRVAGAESAPRNPPPPVGCKAFGKGRRRPPPCPHQDIISLYHELLPMLPHVEQWTRARAVVLAARWREDQDRQNLEWWRGYFTFVRDSKFLTGRSAPTNGRPPFRASLPWLTKLENLVKVAEDKYHQ